MYGLPRVSKRFEAGFSVRWSLNRIHAKCTELGIDQICGTERVCGVLGRKGWGRVTMYGD